MLLDDTIRFFHLIAAMVWIGGMITVAVAVPVLRKSGATIEQIRAVARRFGVTAWGAMAVSVTTGIIQIERTGIELRGNTALMLKLMLVGLAITIAWAHQIAARNLSPAVRGMVEGLLLLIGLGIVASAVAL
jgi:putative copper export protein